MTEREALKLALEGLEEWDWGNDPRGADKYITAIKEALANDTSQERVDETSKNVQKPCGLECDCTDVCKQVDYKALWQQMCERCDELDKRLSQSEQEPVAWIHNFIEGGISIGKRPADLERHPDRWTALYKDSKPCSTCEALARTVMLDQTSHDTTPPQRKPLTDEEKQEWIDAMPYDPEPRHCMILVNVIEAKLKEKNT